ncbi:MAG TPA: anaerobic ribonucleoside-triphosphate reductase activating protein [Thermotoga sp.]|nr:anaerobic ribonucleoside-triphosphate reductase activating protein [Thermotoga sp.]
MKVAGIRTFSLVDYPGKPCAVVFTAGCNFRCPWCHNWEIAYGNKNDLDIGDQAFKILRKIRERLDAVCVTGGEPTIHNNLPEFLSFLKNLRYFVKLDTNGSNPKIIEHVISEKLVDYIALDLKAKPENYPKITGIKYNYWNNVMKTISILRESGIKYEYRMTYVPGLLDEKDLIFLSKLLKDDEKLFVAVANPTEKFKPHGHIPKLDFKNLVWR